MDPELLEDIYTTLPEHIIEELGLLYKIDIPDFPYDARSIKHKFLDLNQTKNDEEVDEALPQKKPEAIAPKQLVEIVMIDSWNHQYITQEHIFISGEYLPANNELFQHAYSIMPTIEGNIFEHVALLTKNNYNYGFIRYFTTTIPPETGIHQILQEQDTLYEVLKHYQNIETDFKTYNLDTNIIAKTIQLESNRHEELNKVTEQDFGVIKNIALSKEVVEEIKLMKNE